MIYEDFENTLVSKDNTRQNPNESYTNNFQKHVACSYGYKLMMINYEYVLIMNLLSLLNHTQVKMFKSLLAV